MNQASNRTNEGDDRNPSRRSYAAVGDAMGAEFDEELLTRINGYA